MICTLRKTCLWMLVQLFFCHAWAQYAPAADRQGTTAIWKDSSAFVEWATGCTIQRGPMNISNPSLGYASVGDGNSAIGQAGTNGVVSLGDGGVATLTFNKPIYNGPGFDFAVFENGFMTGDTINAFLEFAFVEVSSDGINFFRFPAISDIQDTTQLVQQGINCTLVNNLAGKYVANYGTPFDLDELQNQSGLDLNNVTHVRIIDVVGSINAAYATYDSGGHKINDPWPTPFASCGFDLDAVGVINANAATSIQQTLAENINVYPNPLSKGQQLNIDVPAQSTIQVFSALGKLLHTYQTAYGKLRVQNDLSSGLYFINVQTENAHYNTKLVIE